MKLLTISYEGAEEIMKNEIKDLINSDSRIGPSTCIAEIKETDRTKCMQIYSKLAYLGQSFSHVIELIDHFNLESFEELNQISKLDFKELNKKTFRVTCLRIGEQSFSSKDVEPRVGEIILETIEKNNKNSKEQIETKVDLNSPDVEVFVYIYNNKCYSGYNYANLDLSKRDYRVYSHPKSIKGTLAYILLKIAEYDGKQILMDSFAHSGEIAIEAAFIKSKFPINYFRKEKFGKFIDRNYLEKLDKERIKEDVKRKSKSNNEENDYELDANQPKREINIKSQKTIYAFDNQLSNVKATKQNSIIAGIKDYIDTSKIDAEWLDVKMKENSIEVIVTNPEVPHRANHRDIKKKYEEFFYNSEYVLKKEGKIYAISNKLFRETATQKYFKLIRTITLKKGNQILEVDVYAA